MGSVLLRGAGCIINDLWDRNIDKLVERTRTRPLAAGTLTPTQALLFLAGHLGLGLGVLVQFNVATVVLGVWSLALVVTYPLMKRITGWPQAFLGFTFNYGVLMAACASIVTPSSLSIMTLLNNNAALTTRGVFDVVAGELSGAVSVMDWPTVLCFYAAGISWTLVYDTIYALQDKLDDIRSGKVKSTAITFGRHLKLYLAGFAGLSVAGFGFAGVFGGLEWPYYLFAVGGTGAQYAWLISRLQPGNRAQCGLFFKLSWRIGGLVCVALLLNSLYDSLLSRIIL